MTEWWICLWLIIMKKRGKDDETRKDVMHRLRSEKL